MWNGSGEALSGYSITNGVLGVAMYVFLWSRSISIYDIISHLYITYLNGDKNDWEHLTGSRHFNGVADWVNVYIYVNLSRSSIDGSSHYLWNTFSDGSRIGGWLGTSYSLGVA